MLIRRFYYHFKPFLPWRLRLGLRRAWYKRKRATCTDVWPINLAAKVAPAGWTGWPEGKAFAFVLTHDVESSEGVKRCRALMDVETQMGFRSSFNFIPEGTYTIPDEFRSQIAADGFEIGVHDLRHDGKLYRNRAEFRQNAQSINHYLKDWKAVGFRSGFMLHNLDWLHDLNIQYDASTFDTDPFEPQPDGVDSIFPFFVQKPEIRGQKSEVRDQRSDHLRPRSSVLGPPSSVLRPRSSVLCPLSSVLCPRSSVLRPPSSAPAGYVELPYTLPQDFSLFILMREKTIAIWKQKLDWIAENHGMVLLDVHPDYMQFNGDDSRDGMYPAAQYQELLEYVRNRYKGAYWHALPREVAECVRQM